MALTSKISLKEQGEIDYIMGLSEAAFEEKAQRHADIADRMAYRQGYIGAKEDDQAHAASLRAEKAKLDAAAVKDGAVKFDGGKAPVMQGCIERFPLAIEQIALVSEYGFRKYGTYDGWEKLDDAFNRYNDAGGRHTVLRASEGEYDVNDSGLPHLAQRAWNALSTLELALREGIIEMSPGNVIEGGKPVIGSNGRSNT